MSRLTYYGGPLLLAGVLAAGAFSLARPVGQRCAEAAALGGTTAAAPLMDDANTAYRDILKSGAPGCAITGVERTVVGTSKTEILTTTPATTNVKNSSSKGTTKVSATKLAAAVGETSTTTTQTFTQDLSTSPVRPTTPAAAHRNLPAHLNWSDQAREYFTYQGLSTTAWALLGLALLLVARTVYAVVLSRLPGPVDVGSVTDASGRPESGKTTGPADPAVAAQIHDRLGAQQLFGSPEVPGGGIPTAVATTLKDTSLPSSGAIAAIVNVLPSLVPKSGVAIDAVMRTRPRRPTGSAGLTAPVAGCTMTLTDRATGDVLVVFTVWKTSAHAAADAAALSAIAFILDRPQWRRRTPVWARFGMLNQAALAAFINGQDLEQRDDARKHRKQIVTAYQKALELDPGNLTIALKLGNAQELLAAEAPEEAREVLWLNALETYSRASRLWPETFAPRYRKAIVLDQLAWMRPEFRQKHASRYVRAGVGGVTSRDALIKTAGALLESLEVELRPYLIASKVRERRHWKYRGDGSLRYFKHLQRESVRGPLQASYEMARFTTARDKTLAERKKGVEVLLRDRPRVDSRVRYNAACFYSRNWFCAEANEQLELVLRDPENRITGTWMKDDPDLKNFHAWLGEKLVSDGQNGASVL